MSRPSVIVIGAGVVGCTVAYELAKAGARVQVFDTRAPGQGATRASAGILAPFIEGHGSAALRELGTRSLDLYDGFISRLREDLGVPGEGESPREIPYERTGTLELAMSDEEADRLRALSASLSGLGVESSWVEPSGFATVEPHASPEAKGGLLIPTHGYVGVTALTLGAMEAARKLYARFKSETGAIRILTLPNRRIGVKTTHATWEADRVVLAAGSWSSNITVEGADTVPVKPIRGQLLQLQSAPGTLNRVLWGPGGYLVPWVDGAVLVGSTVEDVGFDESHTEEAVTRLRDMAVSLVPSLANAPLIDVRTGLRPKGPDDLPVLGPSRVIPGLIYATAHYRNGVLFVPLTAQLVADLVFNRGGDAALEHLQPSRVGKL